eukprot:m.232080 g.232080  ORF g.232080 m.232080 type:complete len:392 (+) comp18572_c0_seq1:281-1456(+)
MAEAGFRDVYGSAHKERLFTRGEPGKQSEAIHSVPREQNVHLNHHTQIFDKSQARTEGPNDTKITAQPAPSPVATAPRPRRTLPSLSSPANRGLNDSSKENLGFDAHASTPRTSTADAFSPDATTAVSDVCIKPLEAALKCRFCTATGSGTHLKCMHCDNLYCMACLNSASGTMFAYNDEGSPFLRCGKCGRNPRTCPVAERPPWQGPPSIPGAPLLPFVDAHKGEENKLLRAEDKLFLSMLRNDDINVTTMSDGPAPSSDAPLPKVFQRLTDPKQFSGSHRKRFSSDGVGLGLEGRREDTLVQEVIAGRGSITRTIEPEMDCPNRPTLSFESERRSGSRNSSMRQDDTADEIFERLHRTPIRAASASGEYESMQKVRRNFGMGEHKAAWQ